MFHLIISMSKEKKHCIFAMKKYRVYSLITD